MRRTFFKLAAFVLLATLPPWHAVAQGNGETRENPTAYTALRLVGKTLGADVINHVVEVTGRDGLPQPTTWKIVVQDGAGSKEIEVVNGKIEAQRPLSRPAVGAPIKLTDLNLDSSGAFDATDAQARKVHVRFDSINYTLRTGEKTGTPLWTLELLNQAGASAGTMRIAASNGAIISSAGPIAAEAAAATPKAVVDGKPTPKPAATPRAAPTPRLAVTTTVERPTPTPRREVQTTAVTTTTVTVQNNPAPLVDVPDANGPETVPPADGSGGFFTRSGRTLDHTSQNVGHSLDRASQDVNHGLRRAGATVQRFFTGHSDLDSDGRPAPVPSGQPD